MQSSLSAATAQSYVSTFTAQRSRHSVRNATTTFRMKACAYPAHPSAFRRRHRLQDCLHLLQYLKLQRKPTAGLNPVKVTAPQGQGHRDRLLCSRGVNWSCCRLCFRLTFAEALSCRNCNCSFRHKSSSSHVLIPTLSRTVTTPELVEWLATFVS